MSEEQAEPRRVLVAEDEGLIRLDIVETLTQAGFEVVGEAADGEEAVELALEPLLIRVVFADEQGPTSTACRPLAVSLGNHAQLETEVLGCRSPAGRLVEIRDRLLDPHVVEVGKPRLNGSRELTDLQVVGHATKQSVMDRHGPDVRIHFFLHLPLWARGNVLRSHGHSDKRTRSNLLPVHPVFGTASHV